ncbi:hypothetical protein, partial [uncultured Desulfovibrio sp.]|uniref:hypothetical protein n=1 Tax=uncultured Desulfovibrio sp. TaxID=167968 RepID=UPI0026329200
EIRLHDFHDLFWNYEMTSTQSSRFLRTSFPTARTFGACRAAIRSIARRGHVAAAPALRAGFNLLNFCGPWALAAVFWILRMF